MRFSKILVFTLFLFGVFSVFKAPSDPDFGWHYKYGEYIVQHGKILRENIYSHTFIDYRWANSYWISQVAVYLTHRYLGHLIAGLLFAGVLSLSAIFYVRAVEKYSRPIILLSTLATILLFVEFSGSGVAGRPMYFSTLFLMFLVVILMSDSRKKLLVLPPLFLIWANTHADFILGLFIFGLYVGGKIIGDVRKASLYVATGILSVAVTLLNPYGVGLWETLIKESHPYQFSYISEWVPASVDNLHYFVVYCVVLGLMVSALVGARHKLPPWYVLALGFFCIAAVRSQYFFRIAVILGIPAFVTFWAGPLMELRNALSQKLVKKIKGGFIAFLLLSTLATGAVFLKDVSQCVDPRYWVEKQRYPEEALNFALANKLEGNVFNYYGWGGYMIWKYPQVKTFVDGRMPSWREGKVSVFEDYIKLVTFPKKNINVLDDYGVVWVLYPTDSELVKYLKTSNSSWKEMYSDDFATVFVETTGFGIINP